MPKWAVSIFVTLLGRVIESVPPDKVRGFLDDVLKAAERVVTESETKVDDKLLLPGIQKIREAFLTHEN